MKVIEFTGNTRECNYEYHVTREGPNRFISYYKNSSRLFYDINEGWKNCWRTQGTAKFTPSAQELKAWCEEMHLQHTDKTVEEGRKDTSFASEAQAEEPNDNTRMVT